MNPFLLGMITTVILFLRSTVKSASALVKLRKYAAILVELRDLLDLVINTMSSAQLKAARLKVKNGGDSHLFLFK